MKHNEFWQNDPAALAARGGAGAGAALPAAGLCGTGGAEIPVTVRTDGAAYDTVYTVEITPLDNAPTPAQTSVQVKGGGTVYFTGLTFDAPGITAISWPR